MYFLVFRYLQTGGVETLTLREGKWFAKNKGETCIITQVITDEMKELYRSINVKVVVLQKWTAKSINEAITSFNNKIDLVHMYDLGDFLRYKSRFPKSNIKLIYYCVHPISDCYFHSSDLAKKILNPIFSNAVSIFNKNKNIIYMDNDTLSAHINHYGLEKERKLFSVLPLPYEVEEHPMHKRENSIFNILTISRAEYPYKGYVFGLIDELNNNYENILNYKLTIISKGNDIERLKEKVNSLDERRRDCIQLIEGVAPDRLPEYYSKADLYIGMGTTLLEAASFGVPAIATQYNTYEFLTTGRFEENPTILGSNDSNGHKGFDYVKSIMLLTMDEYKVIQKKTVEALLANYDENIILEKLDNWKCNNDKKLSVFSNLFFKMYFFLRDRIFG